MFPFKECLVNLLIFFQYDSNMVLMLRLILCFNPDTELLLDRKAVEKAQLYYCLMLKRYLR